ncbi:MAG: ABC transporter ATP-binding protein [Rhodobacteraceae bacterium]|jgi:branched-chain amino acid transport system ATP-binding protein|nr:ABC transporter ATP-binding protein [Paracoccaceae bacterium]MBT6297927.1 ABC transporter ATP-binding protein [Paracoccaceae bacterium]HBS39792.1 branched-chain amino acid ABC transporter ATP-binding protein [Paracoccaceae bacterium]|tara:strand:+ start:981 stop:1682 length:702 start_codon:yes stop_codon:yes gene_type:complete
MLDIQNLHAGYGQMKVLQGIDLNIQQGEIVALLGSNGAGKSTLNNNISGIYEPTAGAILFEGENITGLRSEQVVQKGIIHVPEGRRIFPNISVRENLELGSYLRGQKNRKANLDRVVGVFPRLQERFSQLAGTLSGGEQQMLAIGRGMMAEPRLMILDEPSLGLSPLLVEEMFGLIQDLNKTGLSFFLVEQNVMQSLEIADRAYVIENGKIVLSGNTDALLDDPELKKSYLGV